MPSARAKRSAAQAELPAVAGTTTTTTTAAVAEEVGGGGGAGGAGVDENNNNINNSINNGDGGGQRRSARSNNVATTTGGGGSNNAAGKGATTTTKEEEEDDKEQKQIIHYRIGEVLTKYFADSNNVSDVFEVRIPAECTVSTNRQVRGHQLWGTDVYTSDSDVVAVLMHCGYYVPSLQVPPSLHEIRARVRRVDDVSDEFRSSSRNGIRSRAWGKSGFAKKKTIGGEKLVAAPAPAAVGAAAGTPADAKEGETKEAGEGENAEGGEGGVAASAAHPLSNGVLQTSNGQIINADDFGMVVESAVAVTVNQQIIELMPTAPESLRYMVVPTFVPEDKERAQRTRAASNANVNVARKKRMIREVTVLYNLCNEPWMKYSMAAVADKGFKKSQWTSARLRRDTLYLETKDERYQLSWVKGKGKDENEGSYQFAKCKRALPLEEMRKKGIPLPKDELKDEIKNLSWNEVKFGVRGLKVKESEYPVTRLQFLAQTSSA